VPGPVVFQSHGLHGRIFVISNAPAMQGAKIAGIPNPAKLYRIHAGARGIVGFNFSMGRIQNGGARVGEVSGRTRNRDCGDAIAVPNQASGAYTPICAALVVTKRAFPDRWIAR
jgi:hypothetical protein